MPTTRRCSSSRSFAHSIRSAERNAEAYGPPHYAAYVIRKQCDAARLRSRPGRGDRRVDRRAAPGAARSARRRDLKLRARAVDELVMRPLRAALGERHAAADLSGWRPQSRAVRSAHRRAGPLPDRALRDELPDERPRSAAACRSLAQIRVSRSSSPIRCSANRQPAIERSGPSAGTEPSPRRSVTTGDDLSSDVLRAARRVRRRRRARSRRSFPDATLLTGVEATKATLQRVEAPRMLHIASHGFFLQDARETARSPAVACRESAAPLRAGAGRREPDAGTRTKAFSPRSRHPA